MSDASFLAWCQQHGITTHGVQPGYVAEGWRGVIATREIPPGSIVMSVPKQLLMSVMSARRDPQLASVLHHHQLNSHQVLAIHLLHEASKSSSSLWYAYIRQLPVTYTTFMCWPAEAVEALQLQHAQDAAIAAADKSRREWIQARPALQQLGLAKKWCSLGAWHWASSCVLSRTMYHPNDPSCGCLTPLADLHNHASPPPPYTPDLVDGVQRLLGRAVQQNIHPSAGEGSACAVRSDGAKGCCGSAAAVVLKMTAGAAAAEQCTAASATETSAAAAAPAASDAGPANSVAAAAADIANDSSPVTAVVSADAGSAVGSGLAAADAVGDSHDSSRHCPTAFCGERQGHEGGHAPGTTAAGTARISPSSSSSVDGAANTAGNIDSQDMLWGDGHYDATTQTYNIVARCSYSPGDQVFLCYGRHCNLDLLELYGFLIPGNPHGKAHLSVGIVEQALRVVQQQQQQQQQGERQWRRRQHQQQQRAVAVGAALDVVAADCYIHNTGLPSWQLLKALRLAAASPAEFHTLSHLAFSGEAMSVSSERTALLALMQACALQLQRLPTTLEQDQALLSSMTKAAVMTQGSSTAVAEQNAPSAAPAAAADSSRDTSDNHSGVSSTIEQSIVPTIDHLRPQQQPTDQQQSASRSFSSAAEQQQQQCIVLSVQWRACYKRALAECIGQCRKSVSTLEGD